MSKKNIRLYYYELAKVITTATTESTVTFTNLKVALDGLINLPSKNRLMKLSHDEILELKIIKKPSDQNNNKWELGFLRNTTETSFKNKIGDSVTEAEKLDPDEYLGYETCCLYDESKNILAIQNNAKSIGANSIALFFQQFIQPAINLRVNIITDEFERELNEISDECRTLEIGIKDLSKIDTSSSDEESVARDFCRSAKSMGTKTLKVQVGLGSITKDSKEKTLNIKNIKNSLKFLKKNKSELTSLKIKLSEDGSIRIIDLINNKLSSEFKIDVTKADPKTFEKILQPMYGSFDWIIKTKKL